MHWVRQSVLGSDYAKLKNFKAALSQLRGALSVKYFVLFYLRLITVMFLKHGQLLLP